MPRPHTESSIAPDRRHMEEKENTEKKRKTQKQERILVSERVKNRPEHRHPRLFTFITAP